MGCLGGVDDDLLICILLHLQDEEAPNSPQRLGIAFGVVIAAGRAAGVLWNWSTAHRGVRLTVQSSMLAFEECLELRAHTDAAHIVAQRHRVQRMDPM